MKIDIMTLFPDLITGVMQQSIIGRAQAKGLIEITATNIRDYALDKHHKADDAPLWRWARHGHAARATLPVP